MHYGNEQIHKQEVTSTLHHLDHHKAIQQTCAEAPFHLYKLYFCILAITIAKHLLKTRALATISLSRFMKSCKNVCGKAFSF